VVGQIGIAIRAAALVALIASVLVLAGALAAGNRSRIHDAVVLKTLGATRATLIRAYVYEYGLLGLATAVFALAFGGVASWFVVSRIMTLPSEFMPDIALLTLVGALVLTVGIGLLGTWRVLGQKPHRFCGSFDGKSSHLLSNSIGFRASCVPWGSCRGHRSYSYYPQACWSPAAAPGNLNPTP
jgi:predicted lysophospholipase L1 biosynthesis ABC-type transport system permease subunit